eukprot:gene20703-biopygen17090
MALPYPIAQVPLALATCDGCDERPQSKLFEAAMSSLVNEDSYPNDAKVYVIDYAAYVCSVLKVPNTFKKLTIMLLKGIPSQFQVVYVACDMYQGLSIKNAERQSRGHSSEFVIKNAGIRIPLDFTKFLSNRRNEERLFELVEDVWTEEVLALERDSVNYIAGKMSCTKISRNGSFREGTLETNYEKPDTKICYSTSPHIRTYFL